MRQSMCAAVTALLGMQAVVPVTLASKLKSGQSQSAAEVAISTDTWNTVFDVEDLPHDVTIDIVTDSSEVVEARPPPNILDQMLLQDFSRPLSIFQDLDMQCSHDIDVSPEHFSMEGCTFPMYV